MKWNDQLREHLATYAHGFCLGICQRRQGAVRVSRKDTKLLELTKRINELLLEMNGVNFRTNRKSRVLVRAFTGKLTSAINLCKLLSSSPSAMDDAPSTPHQRHHKRAGQDAGHSMKYEGSQP